MTKKFRAGDSGSRLDDDDSRTQAVAPDMVTLSSGTGTRLDLTPPQLMVATSGLCQSTSRYTLDSFGFP